MEKTLAYTAGYLEGDGCFHIGKKISPIKYDLRIAVTSSHEEVLHWFKSLYGGSVHICNQSTRRENESFHSQWVVSGQQCFNLCTSLLPYLKEKKCQAEACLKFFQEKDRKVKDLLIKEMRDFKKFQDKVTASVVEELRAIQKTETPSDIDFAYLAGFIDAECCFTINKYRSAATDKLIYKICLQCCTTTYPTLFWIAKNVGGSFHFKPILKKNHNHKVDWRFGSKKLNAILPSLIPFLIHKRPVAEKLIEFYKTTLTNGGDRHSDSFKERYAEILAVRSEIARDINQLNSKGFFNT